MASLVDTNVLVYSVDPRFPGKRERAREVLHGGMAGESLLLPHQAIVEFVAATTRSRPGAPPLLSREDALSAADTLLQGFPVLYPDAQVLRKALEGAALFRLPWYDANLWACAERYGCETILSEDFQHDRLYGSVRVVNPFLQGPAA